MSARRKDGVLRSKQGVFCAGYDKARLHHFELVRTGLAAQQGLVLNARRATCRGADLPGGITVLNFLHDIVVRMQPGAKLSQAQVRRALANVDPDMPVVRMQTLTD